MIEKHKIANAQQIFRQFTWSLAGTRAQMRASGKGLAKPAGER